MGESAICTRSLLNRTGFYSSVLAGCLAFLSHCRKPNSHVMIGSALQYSTLHLLLASKLSLRYIFVTEIEFGATKNLLRTLYAYFCLLL